jgi:cytochrome c oxidase cbb3-type subunit 3
MSDKKLSRKPGEVETTGHVWDGVQEFKNPLPRWWVWIFYATIAFSVVYTILYPAWPLINGATQGLRGWSSRATVAEEIRSFEQANAPWREKLVAADLTQIQNDPELLQFARNAGAAVFRTNCSQCHGSGAAGVQAAGYPNLLDDDWLWGGTIDDIVTTVTHGIRNTTNPEARYSQMPAFGTDGLLEPAQIDAVVQYVMSLSGAQSDPALLAEGATVFAENCAACHGENGQGDRTQGAPNLTDAIWLYGGDQAALTESVAIARFGVMPAWNTRLSESDIRAVAVYVHGLGGGE